MSRTLGRRMLLLAAGVAVLSAAVGLLLPKARAKSTEPRPEGPAWDLVIVGFDAQGNEQILERFQGLPGMGRPSGNPTPITR